MITTIANLNNKLLKNNEQIRRKATSHLKTKYYQINNLKAENLEIIKIVKHNTICIMSQATIYIIL